MKKTVAEVVVDMLQGAGAKHCYGIVGDTLNYFTDAIHDSEIEWVHMRHEEVGAFAAGAEAFVADRLAVCAGSCGPGSLHFINGLYESHRNNAPVVLIASQLPNTTADPSFPQYVDFKQVYQECSVFCEEITQPEQAVEVTKQAIMAALSQRGVAVIILPSNVSLTKIAYPKPVHVYYEPPQLFPNETSLSALALLLNSGKKVTIFAGIGAKEAREEILELAQRLKAPVAHTSRVKDFLDYDNPYNMGMTGMIGLEPGFNAVKNCEILLLLGTDFAWPQFYPEKGIIIQVDHCAANIGKRHAVGLGVVGGVKETLQKVLPQLHPQSDTTFLDEHQQQFQKEMAKQDFLERGAKASLIHPQYLVQLLSKHATQDAIFTADGGSAMVWMLRHIDVNGQRRTLTSLKHGTMANAMPQALGFSKAFPQRQVISISGDGGLAMLLGDLLTIRQEKLNTKIVVLNNGSLNFVELEQKVEGLVDNYTDLDNPDFSQVAQAMGIWGEQVTEAAHLEEAVQRFLAHEGPALLDVHTAQNELVMPPNVELREVMGMGLYTAKAVLEGRGAEAIALIRDNYLRS